MSVGVTAIPGGPPAARARCERALAELSIPVAASVAAAPDGLLWLLSSGGVPDAGTLPLLLGAREEVGVELVSGVAADGSGSVIRWLAPTARKCDTAQMYEMLGRSRMPLVAAGTDCLLVPRDLALPALSGKEERYGRLAERVAVSEMLREHRGAIVPAARVTVDPGAAPPLRIRDLPAGVRAMRAGATVPRDLLNMVAPNLR
jgi:hypothetical protein